MKKTNIGVQWMPAVFLVCSVAFLAMNSKVYAGSCFVLAILFGVVLIGEALKD